MNLNKFIFIAFILLQIFFIIDCRPIRRFGGGGGGKKGKKPKSNRGFTQAHKAKSGKNSNENNDQENDEDGDILKNFYGNLKNDNNLKEYENLSNKENEFSDDEINEALSKLTKRELNVLDKLINNEDEKEEREKRSFKMNIPQNEDYDDYNTNDFDEDNNNDDVDNDASTLHGKLYERQCYNEGCKGECRSKKFIFRGKRDNEKSDGEKKNQTITAPKDNEKQLKENHEIKSEIIRRSIPYFNSKLGPHITRRKREIADNPQSSEHIKLLEESFPKEEKTFPIDQPLVRVKRTT